MEKNVQCINRSKGVNIFSISIGYLYIDMSRSTIKKIVQCVAFEAANINKHVMPSNEITEPLKLTVYKKGTSWESHCVTVMF